MLTASMEHLLLPQTAATKLALNLEHKKLADKFSSSLITSLGEKLKQPVFLQQQAQKKSRIILLALKQKA